MYQHGIDVQEVTSDDPIKPKIMTTVFHVIPKGDTATESGQHATTVHKRSS
jgi:hypothetical protein